MPVYINRPPHSARLVTWGRAPNGWWGCVTFRQPIRTENGREELPVAAWMPAKSLTQPGWARTNEVVPRTNLGPDPKTWPAPIGWPSWFAGVWVQGPLTLPAGVAVAEGPAWRK